jgi:uncharacterized repeat protein (TIGR03803 family)
MPSPRIISFFHGFIVAAHRYLPRRARVWVILCVLALVCAAVAIATSAQTFTTLVNLNESLGSTFPSGGLVQGRDGNLYGPAAGNSDLDYGAIFRVTPTGEFTTIINFVGSGSAGPSGALALGTDGDFYGETNSPIPGSDGSIFRATPGGTLNILYRYVGSGNSRFINANAAPIEGNDGNFYGTTYVGGAGSCEFGCGTFFQITTAGAYTTLYQFTTSNAAPIGPLVLGTNGNFYGISQGGGAGGGTVFEITPSGDLTTIYGFSSARFSQYGGIPGSLILGNDRNLYGSTTFGGKNNKGNVFKLTPTGALTVLNSLDRSDGYGVELAQATDGNLYATANAGGANNYGSLLEITLAGKVTVLHSFEQTDGAQLSGLLFQATNGILYGTTYRGGTSHEGTIYSLSVGLAPFVEIVPASAKVGQIMHILGTDLTGATSVTFNGTPATFTVVSGTQIKATVPAGATTGSIQVTTPNGTLTSNIAFTVQT